MLWFGEDNSKADDYTERNNIINNTSKCESFADLEVVKMTLKFQSLLAKSAENMLLAINKHR